MTMQSLIVNAIKPRRNLGLIITWYKVPVFPLSGTHSLSLALLLQYLRETPQHFIIYLRP
jgi:hypothetical protein